MIGKKIKFETAIYGKLPAYGDFISHGINRRTQNHIDKWMVDILSRTREKWKDDFSEKFRVAQPWFFNGKSKSAIIIPSVDKVGRLFPFFASVSRKVRFQSFYDSVYDAISRQIDSQTLFDSIHNLEHQSVEVDPAGWFLLESEELALAHPLNGDREFAMAFKYD